jgi:HAMP domain-containing protein
VFLVIAGLAALAFLVIGARWLTYRIRGINPLANELAALQKMREAKSNG